jgi:hypothetical protein
MSMVLGIGTVPKQIFLTMESMEDMEGLRPEEVFFLHALHVLHGENVFKNRNCSTHPAYDYASALDSGFRRNDGKE